MGGGALLCCAVLCPGQYTPWPTSGARVAVCMGGRDGWMDGWMDGLMDGWVGKWVAVAWHAFVGR